MNKAHHQYTLEEKSRTLFLCSCHCSGFTLCDSQAFFSLLSLTFFSESLSVFNIGSVCVCRAWIVRQTVAVSDRVC